jgi:hypothetical protein
VSLSSEANIHRPYDLNSIKYQRTAILGYAIRWLQVDRNPITQCFITISVSVNNTLELLLILQLCIIFYLVCCALINLEKYENVILGGMDIVNCI